MGLVGGVCLQVNVEAMPDGPENPYGNGFIPVETDLTTELKAQRVCDPSCARLWKIKNPNSLQPVTGARRWPVPWFRIKIGVQNQLKSRLRAC